MHADAADYTDTAACSAATAAVSKNTRASMIFLELHSAASGIRVIREIRKSAVQAVPLLPVPIRLAGSRDRCSPAVAVRIRHVTTSLRVRRNGSADRSILKQQSSLIPES